MSGQTQRQGMIAAAVLAMAASAWADTQTFQFGDNKAGTAGYKDTSVWSKTEADNSFGSYPKIRVRTPSSNPRCNGLLAWPSLIGSASDQIPANATITAATLEVHVRTESVTPNADYWVAQLYKDWFEADGTYSGLGTHDQHYTTWKYAQAYGDGVGNVPWTDSDPNVDASGGGMNQADADLANGVGGVVGSGLAETWDVKSIVQNWVNGQANYGFLLYVQPNSGGLAGYLQPKETNDPSPFIPMLTIEYSLGSVVTNATWAGTTDSNWSVGTNWVGGTVPNAAGAIANFAAGATTNSVSVDAPQTVGVINLSSAASYAISGTSTLTLDGGTGSTSINVTAGNHTINAPIVLAKDTAVAISGGGVLSVQHVRGAGLSVSGGTMKIIAQGTANSASGTSKVTALSVASGAALDLTNNSLIVDYTAVGTLVDDTRLMLQSGKLTSSSTGGKLGYGDNAILGKATLAGQSVDSTSLLVKFTYGGDANLDGQVDISDLGSLATAWQTSAPWTGGDFDYSGFVDISDLGILATNWQLGVGAPLGPSFDQALASVGLGSVTVPEPATIGLLGLCLAGVSARRNRRI